MSLSNIWELIAAGGGIATALTIIGLLVRFTIKQYKDSRADKAKAENDKLLIVAEERAKLAEENLESYKNLYEKFLETYENTSVKFEQINKHAVEAIALNKIALNSLENAVNQSAKINEKLADSVDKLKDTITNNLIQITK